MLRPERMDRVRIFCRKEETPSTITVLAELRALHITTHTPEEVHGRLIGNGMPIGDVQMLSDALVKTRSMIERLHIDTLKGSDSTTNSNEDDAQGNSQTTTRVHAQTALRISEEYATLERKMERNGQAIALAKEQDELLEMLMPLESPIEAIEKTRSVRTMVIRGKIPAGITPLFIHHDQNRDVTIVILRESDSRVISKAHSIDLTPLRSLTGSPTTARTQLSTTMAQLMRERDTLLQEQTSYREHSRFLRKAELELTRALLEAQAPLSFGQTQHITIIEGFVPTNRIEELKNALREKNIMGIVDSDHAENAPTALHNPRITNSFEALLRLYSLPKYNEIDPTSLMAITFPLFFGFIIGDIGYGIAALMIFAAIKWKYKMLRSLADIFMLSAISTIIFGIIYGEFFGGNTILGIALTPILHRTQEMGLLFAIAISLGIFHLNLGNILGIMNARKNPRAAIGKMGWVLLQLSAILIIAHYGFAEGIPVFGAIPAIPLIPATLLFLISIAMLIGAERARGLVEIPAVISNTLSYTRLVALGLSSIYLAFVVNTIAEELFAKGGIMLAIGVLVLLIGHTINLMLGLLGAFLHSLRLHYVEFYGKFYEGGGTPYKPFGEIEVPS